MSSKMMKVGAAHLIDVCPFGIFNRFMPNLGFSIYLENGMIDLGNMGFRNPEAYKPCTLYTNPEQVPINGNITIVPGENPSHDGSGCVIPSISKITYDTKFSSKYVSGTESKVFGCAAKTDSVDMTDPRGEGKDCYTYYQKTMPTTYPIINPAFGAGGMIEVFLTTMEAYLSSRAASVSNTVCRKRDTTISNYKAESKSYCSEEIIYKKYTGREFPGSLFTGKMRLWVQSMMGGLTIKTQMKDTGFGYSLEIEPYAGNPGENFRPDGVSSELRERRYELSPRSHIVHRDNLFNYYLVNTSSWSFTYLEPSESGRKIRTYLREKVSTLSKKDIMAYEAYLLSTCLPSRSAPTDADVQFEVGGSPFHFDWHGNLNGNKAARVGIGSIENHSRSSIQTVDLEIDAVALYEEENRRKKESILRQEKTNDFASGNGWVYKTVGVGYSLKAGVNVNAEDFDPLDPDKYCFSGDLENGAWFFLPKKDQEGNTTEQDGKSADQLNKQYGGFVMSKEYCDTFRDYTTVTADESDYTEFQFRAGKVYSWDDFQKAYYYHNLDYHDPRKARTFEGDFTAPLYCWYDENDRLKVLNYYEVGTSDYDKIVENPEYTCSAAFNYHTYQESFTSGTYFHGFSVSPDGAEDKAYRGSRSTSTSDYSGTDERSDAEKGEGNWEWVCPPFPISCPNPELVDWRLEASPGVGPGCKGDWWVSLGKSVHQYKSSSVNDSNSGSSFFIVPKSDAECATFGHMDTIVHYESKNFSVTYGTNNVYMWWCMCQFPALAKCAYFVADFDCSGWYYYAFNADRVYYNRWGVGSSWTYDYASGIAANRSVGSLTAQMGISEYSGGSWSSHSLWKRKEDIKVRPYGPTPGCGDLKYFEGIFTPTDNWLAQNEDDHVVIVNDHEVILEERYIGTVYVAGRGSIHTIESEKHYKRKGEFGDFWMFADGPPNPRDDPYIYSSFNVKSGMQNNSLIFASTPGKDRMPLNFPYKKGHVFVGYA